MHIDIKHLGRTFPCEKCDFVATRPKALGRHRKEKHYVPMPEKLVFVKDDAWIVLVRPNATRLGLYL